jgi:hypothetical protein
MGPVGSRWACGAVLVDKIAAGKLIAPNIPIEVIKVPDRGRTMLCSHGHGGFDGLDAALRRPDDGLELCDTRALGAAFGENINNITSVPGQMTSAGECNASAMARNAARWTWRSGSMVGSLATERRYGSGRQQR